jgi:hypothetical protein
MAWEFKYDPHAELQWRWLLLEDATSALLQQSARAFATLYSCTEDAKRYGYTGSAAPVYHHELIAVVGTQIQP